MGAVHVPDPAGSGRDAAVEAEDLTLIYRRMLIGGVPGSGKSGLMNLLAVHAALSDSSGRTAGIPAWGVAADGAGVAD